MSFTWIDEVFDWKYSFTFCGVSICGSTQSALCQESTYLPLSYSLGVWKESQVWNNGGSLNAFAENSILTTFSGGAYCAPSNSSRSTTVYLVCQPNVSLPSLLNVSANSACTYTALVSIPHSMCPPLPVVSQPLLNALQISLIVVGSMFALGIVAFMFLREVHDPEYSESGL